MSINVKLLLTNSISQQEDRHGTCNAIPDFLILITIQENKIIWYQYSET